MPNKNDGDTDSCEDQQPCCCCCCPESDIKNEAFSDLPGGGPAGPIDDENQSKSEDGTNNSTTHFRLAGCLLSFLGRTTDKNRLQSSKETSSTHGGVKAPLANGMQR